jgi:hypothetical protein
MTNHLLSFEGEQYTVNELRVDIHYVSASGPIKWSSFNVANESKPDQTVDQMEAIFGGQRMRIIFPNSPTSEKIVLRMDSLPMDHHSDSGGSPPERLEFPSLPAAYCPLHMPPAHPMVQRKSDSRPHSAASRSFTPKIKAGRNELCPCKSGKKYKHCCLKEHR